MPRFITSYVSFHENEIIMEEQYAPTREDCFKDLYEKHFFNKAPNTYIEETIKSVFFDGDSLVEVYEV
jgi:hypothetical protein